jgi:hypothetical protein
VVQTIPLGHNHLVVGEIVLVHAAADVLVDGIPDGGLIELVFEGVHENQYFALGEPAPLRRHRPYDYRQLGLEQGG